MGDFIKTSLKVMNTTTILTPEYISTLSQADLGSVFPLINKINI